MDNSSHNDKSLQAKVNEWIAGEGYPLEFYTANIFRKNNFRVLQGFHVSDIKSGTPREVDVLAEATAPIGRPFARVCHVVECKWSRDKPWVIFTSPGSRISPAACIAQTIGSDAGQAILWALAGDKETQNLDAFNTPVTPGFNGRQAFNKGNDTFYNAMQSVTSATCSLMQSYNEPNGNPYISAQTAVIGLPVVVVDGKLFETSYDVVSNQMSIKETNRVRIHWRGAELWPVITTIDVVSIDGLEDFVNTREDEMSLLLDKMTGCLKQIIACLKEKSLEPLDIPRAARGIVGLPPLLSKIRAMSKIKASDPQQENNKDQSTISDKT